MKNMSDKLKVIVGEAIIKLGDSALDRCLFMGFYEPKISIELLKKNEK